MNGQVAKSWLSHGQVMAKSWQRHGKVMANSWQIHGKFMAKVMTKSWQVDTRQVQARQVQAGQGRLLAKMEINQSHCSFNLHKANAKSVIVIANA